jgi:hypothetical protein
MTLMMLAGTLLSFSTVIQTLRPLDAGVGVGLQFSDGGFGLRPQPVDEPVSLELGRHRHDSIEQLVLDPRGRDAFHRSSR